MSNFKTLFLILSVILFNNTGLFSQTGLDYFLSGTSYDKNIPSPAEFLGFETGDHHVSHDQLVSYFSMLAQKSSRVKYETYGRTHEGRPLTLAIITSEKNIGKIDEIRAKHLQLSDPSASQNIDLANQPVVVWLSHSIHGNEASGANSSMLTAYHFAAGQGKEIEDILESVVILIDPSTNPDGLQRFSTWVNSHQSYQVNTDPLSREHQEVWPGGRSNHYWFDLNRDWLPLEQPESENRIKALQLWKPNILVDLHEMGSNSTFHFSPGEPQRVNPLIPGENQELTKKLAEGYASSFDKIGSLYFSAEQYDDYYIGRGPTYMDMNGGVSLLFEQASSRGIAQTTENGLLTFRFAIRNQLTGALSTINTAYRLKKDFLSYQRNYYINSLNEAKKSQKKAYVFGSEYDKNMTYNMARLLSTHGIVSYLLGKDITAGGKNFKASSAYVVPLDQPQYKLIESVFEVRKTFVDSIFYDVSAWNIPMAYNLPFESLDAKTFSAGVKGEPFSGSLKPKGSFPATANAYAYALSWSDYYSPAALYKLLSNNITVKVASAPIETQQTGILERGTLIIPLGTVNNKEEVEKTLAEISNKYGINVIPLSTGDNLKYDLGSPTLIRLEKPKIIILTEEGVNGISAGQLWHLFDTRYDMPVTLLPMKSLSSVNLYNYNTLILPDGSYRFDDNMVQKIKTWVSSGNTIIGLERASQWLASSKLANIEFLPGKSINADTYEVSILAEAAQEVPGTIFEESLDLTHPLCFGFHDLKMPVYKDNSIIQKNTELNSMNYPVKYTENSLLSGYSPKGFENRIAGTPAFGIFPLQQGRVVALYNNPVFRGYWRGSNRFLANAIFFGKAVKFSASREQ
jgi:hypothetical protein